MSKAGFRKSLDQAPHARVLFDGDAGSWLTRGELAARVYAAADSLQSPRKALVFLFAANDVDSLVTYLAALEVGHAVVMLDPNLDATFQSRLVSLFCPDFIVAPEAGVTDSTALQSGEYSRESIGAALSLWRANELHRFPIHPDLTLLISTSGSTGSPKLVRLTWRNMESNALALNQVLHITEDDVAMLTSPIFNALGQSVMHTSLLAGGRFVITQKRLVTREYWNIARETGCNSIAGTPYFYQVLKRLDLDTLQVPALTKFVQTGGRLSEDLVVHFHHLLEKRHGRLHVMYGQAESTARISGLPPEYLPGAARSVGFALPGNRVTVEADGKCVPVGEEGELVCEGPSVMMGYALSPTDLSLGDQMHGKVWTGDLGHQDERGLLYITGRRARFAKVFGWRVSLDDIEELLSAVGRVAAVSEEDRIVIYCEHSEGEFSGYTQILTDRVKLHPSAFAFREVDQLPMLASGKINYKALSQAR